MKKVKDSRKNLPVMLAKEVLQSNKLSLTAKGIYAYFISKDSEVFIVEELYKVKYGKKNEIDSAIQELKEYGILSDGMVV
jgi:hypothetical protein